MRLSFGLLEAATHRPFITHPLRQVVTPFKNPLSAARKREEVGRSRALPKVRRLRRRVDG